MSNEQRAASSEQHAATGQSQRSEPARPTVQRARAQSHGGRDMAGSNIPFGVLNPGASVALLGVGFKTNQNLNADNH